MRTILLFLFASVAFAAPKLDVPTEVTANVCDYAEVSVKSDAEGILWQVPDGVKRFDPKKLVDPSTAYFKFPKAGTYWITVIGAKIENGKVDFAEKRIKFTVVDVEKKDVAPKEVIPVDPPVKPDVKPVNPPEKITTSVLTVVVIEETADAAETRGKFFGDKDLAAKINERKHKVLAIDKDVKDKTGKTPAKLAGYLAQAKQLPWVVMVNEAEKVVFSGPMPNDAKAALELLVKYGG